MVGIVPIINVDSSLKLLVEGNTSKTWCSGLNGLYNKYVTLYAHEIHFSHPCTASPSWYVSHGDS